MSQSMGPPPDYYHAPHQAPYHQGQQHFQPPCNHGGHGGGPVNMVHGGNHTMSNNAPSNQSVGNVFAPTMNQPQKQNTNVVVNVGNQGVLYRRWSTNWLGCFEDIGGCLCAIFCTSCMAMGLSSRMNELFCLPYMVPQWLMALRVKIRAANKIKGSIFRDCLATTCCPLCALCQIKRELDNIDKRNLKPDGTL